MAKPLGMPLPGTAAMLSGAVKARPGRKAAGPVVKAPSGIKSAPARPSGAMSPLQALMGGGGPKGPPQMPC